MMVMVAPQGSLHAGACVYTCACCLRVSLRVRGCVNPVLSCSVAVPVHGVACRWIVLPAPQFSSKDIPYCASAPQHLLAGDEGHLPPAPCLPTSLTALNLGGFSVDDLVQQVCIRECAGRVSGTAHHFAGGVGCWQVRPFSGIERCTCPAMHWSLACRIQNPRAGQL